MSLKSVLLAGAAALALLSPLAFVAPAFADQNDETRELNLRQLQNPGSVDADDADDDDGDDGDDAAGDDDDDGAAGAAGDDDDGDDDGGDDEGPE